MDNKVNPRSTWVLIALGLLTIVIIVGGIFFAKRIREAMHWAAEHPTLTSRPKKISPAMQRRNQQAKEIVNDVVTATAVDPKTSLPVNPKTTFFPQEKQIYLVVLLNTFPKGTNISYVRLLGNRYLDSQLTQANDTSKKAVNFVWKTTKGTVRIEGTYTVRVFVNGAFAKEVSYIISK